MAEWLRQRKECPSCGGSVDCDRLIPVYGQGKPADLAGPPPPRPEYVAARRFRWPFGNHLFRPRFAVIAAEMVELIGFFFFVFAVFVQA
jgi:hypothetical protein